MSTRLFDQKGCLPDPCSSPIAQAMQRYWDISALIRELKEEQKLVGEQWDDLLRDMANGKAEEWFEWFEWRQGGENQKKVRKAWEAKNPRFRMTGRGIELRPNVKDH
jgi:hypothetical protein